VNWAKTAEPIKMPFGMWTWVGKYVLEFRWGAHWRHMSNTIGHPCAEAMWPYLKLL